MVSRSGKLTAEFMCVCVCCVYVFMCAGSHRIIDTEFDDGLMVVTKGGLDWGGMVTDHFLVLARRRPALGERAPSLHPLFLPNLSASFRLHCMYQNKLDPN